MPKQPLRAEDSKRERSDAQSISGTRHKLELPDVLIRGDAFTSPLLAPPPRQDAGPHGRLGLLILLGAALVSVGAIVVALLLRGTLHRSANAVQGAATPARTQAPARSTPAAPALPAVQVLAVGGAGEATRAQEPQRPKANASALEAEEAAQAEIAEPSPRERRARAQAALRERRRAARRERAEAAAAAQRDLPQQPSRAEVLAAMKRVTPAVSRCFGDTHGTARVQVTVQGATGRVTTAQVSGQVGEVGSCIARAVRRAKLRPFAQDTLEIGYPFKH